MLIVADGGSSITDWKFLLPDGEVLSFSSKGMNPFFLSEKEIVKILNGIKPFRNQEDTVKEVHFFGAGCNSPDKREIVSNALSIKFPHAFVNVESDLLGSAFATCQNRPGLNCILGTGSNISYFDGENLHEGLHGLGYIFDDEGSGTYFGKKLITDFLYHKMPKHLAEAFNQHYQLSKEGVIKSLYQKPLPNFYLANHAFFLADHLDDPYCIEIIEKGLTDFITTCVCTYENYKEYNCHFVGPVAFYFQDILKRVCKKHEVNTGKILLKPIHELFTYVCKKEGFVALEAQH